MKLAQGMMDQIQRRILDGKKISSIIEEHTWLRSEGKAGRPVDWVPAAIIEYQLQFVLDYQIF